MSVVKIGAVLRNKFLWIQYIITKEPNKWEDEELFCHLLIFAIR